MGGFGRGRDKVKRYTKFFGKVGINQIALFDSERGNGRDMRGECKDVDASDRDPNKTYGDREPVMR